MGNRAFTAEPQVNVLPAYPPQPLPRAGGEMKRRNVTHANSHRARTRRNRPEVMQHDLKSLPRAARTWVARPSFSTNSLLPCT